MITLVMLLVVLAAHWIVVIAVVAVVWGHGLAKRRMVMRQKFERSSSVGISRTRPAEMK